MTPTPDTGLGANPVERLAVTARHTDSTAVDVVTVTSPIGDRAPDTGGARSRFTSVGRRRFLSCCWSR